MQLYISFTKIKEKIQVALGRIKSFFGRFFGYLWNIDNNNNNDRSTKKEVRQKKEVNQDQAIPPETESPVTTGLAASAGIAEEVRQGDGIINNDQKDDLSKASPEERQAILKDLMTRLGSDNWRIRKAVLKDLVELFVASPKEEWPEILPRFRAMFFDQYSDIRQVAAQAFVKLFTDLPERRPVLLGAFTAWLSENPPYLKLAAMEAFLPIFTIASFEEREVLLKALITNSSDDDFDIRKTTVQLLDSVSSIASHEEQQVIVEALRTRLSDQEDVVREVTVQAIVQGFKITMSPEKRRTLLLDFLNCFVKLWDDLRFYGKNAEAAKLFIEVFKLTVPEERHLLLEAFISRFFNDNLYIHNFYIDKNVAMQAFVQMFSIASARERSVLLKAFVSRLFLVDYGKDHMREAAVQILPKVLNIASAEEQVALMEAIRSGLSDNSPYVRIAAEKAFLKIKGLYSDEGQGLNEDQDPKSRKFKFKK